MLLIVKLIDEEGTAINSIVTVLFEREQLREAIPELGEHTAVPENDMVEGIVKSIV